MAVERITYDDELREGTDKINQSINQSNEAITKANSADSKADNAVQTANQANTKSDDTQQQLNNIVINNGESDAEVLQARGTYSVLNERLQATDEQLADVVTVIKPTGTINDSPNLNSLLQSGNKKYLIKKGIYNIEEDVVIKSNSTVEWEEGAIFQKTATNSSGYNIVFMQNVSNVTLINPTIIGDRDIHTGTGGEWGHGLVVRGSNNIKIKNPKISKCWGDGLVVSYSPTAFYSQNVYIDDCLCDYNRRNGFTIGSVKNLYVNDSQFNNTVGTDPQAGIDLEPDSENGELENIVFNNITLNDNSKRGMFFTLWLMVGDHDASPKKNISITCNNVKVNGGNYGFETVMSNFTDTAVSGAPRTGIKNLKGHIVLNNCETKNNAQNGVRLYRWYDVGLKMTFNDLKIINPNTQKGTSTSNNAIVLYDFSGSSTPPEYKLGGVEFNGLEVEHASDDPLKRSVYVNDPQNFNAPTNFAIRNPKKMNGKIMFENGLDDQTGLVVDQNKILKLSILDGQRPIDKYEPYYSIISNKNTTANKTLFINAVNMHYEEITFVNENSFTFTLECNGTQVFVPYNLKRCTLTGYGSSVTVKRVNDLQWQVINQVNASFV